MRSVRAFASHSKGWMFETPKPQIYIVSRNKTGTIIFQQRDTLLKRAGGNFHTTISKHMGWDGQNQ